MGKTFTYLVQATITLRKLEIEFPCQFFVDKTFLDEEYFSTCGSLFIYTWFCKPNGVYVSIVYFNNILITVKFLGVDLYTLFIVLNRIHIREYFLAELMERIPLKNAIF